jgi:hypothetical protein
MDGLAEHVLLILSLQWNEQLETDIKEMDELNNMKKHITTLIIAAKKVGECVNHLKDKNISKMVDSFAAKAMR